MSPLHCIINWEVFYIDLYYIQIFTLCFIVLQTTSTVILCCTSDLGFFRLCLVLLSFSLVLDVQRTNTVSFVIHCGITDIS